MGSADGASLANAEWQQEDRHKQQPLRELDPHEAPFFAPPQLVDNAEVSSKICLFALFLLSAEVARH